MQRFQSAASEQSLAEGLAEYHAAHPGLKRGPALSPEAQAFFRAHDAVHVLYGCGTTLPDEAIVKLSSIFGTTGGFGILRGDRLHESIDICRQLPFRCMLLTMLISPWIIFRTLWPRTLSDDDPTFSPARRGRRGLAGVPGPGR